MLFRSNHFAKVVSIIGAPHNLHNYDELNLPYIHRPLTGADDIDPWLRSFYTELRDLLTGDAKVLVHAEEVGDRIIGIMGGYIRWSGLIDDPSKAIAITERIACRQLDPFARELILRVHELR